MAVALGRNSKNAKTNNSKKSSQSKNKKYEPRRSSSRLATRLNIQRASYNLADVTHFTADECKSLLLFFDKVRSAGKVDRLRFREILHSAFDITDNAMLDLIFRAFDRDGNGYISSVEWIRGFSIILRGTLDELIEFVYFVYDVNGDRSLAREELSLCLKSCIRPNYGIPVDEIDESEREIVDIALKKLDYDQDGQITFSDFQRAVRRDPLLLQAVGPCLPAQEKTYAFLSLFTDSYNHFTPPWTANWAQRGMGRGRRTEIAYTRGSYAHFNFDIANSHRHTNDMRMNKAILHQTAKKFAANPGFTSEKFADGHFPVESDDNFGGKCLP